MPEFLLTLILALIIIFAIKWKLKIEVFPTWKEAVIFFAIVMTFGALWDSFGAMRGYWSYGMGWMLGAFLFVPIEEYLFYFTIMYGAIVVYKAVRLVWGEDYEVR